MNSIRSFSYDGEKEKVILEEFEKIAQREGKKFSSLTIEALKEYVERHKDGNNQMTFDSPNIRAMPQLESSFPKWNKYLESCSPKELKDIRDYADHVKSKSEMLLKK
jgi:hypothetical protein